MAGPASVAMHIDPESGNIIGAGEDAAFQIIQEMTGLPEANLKKHWPNTGLYRQVPIRYLLKTEDLIDLADYQIKSSVDIVIMRSTFVAAVRVEGKKGTLKMGRQRVQKRLLEKNNILVVDLSYLECKQLFKDRVNDASRKEVRDSFTTAKVLIV